ncbi:MAG: hypothetical protein HYT80_04800 [Euryarchaeota archaeon]|nr:hypothetical protein [Euryarchaeota archaeon]
MALVLVAAALSCAPPSASAQGQCATLDVQEQSTVGLSIRPEVDEYRARLTYRSQPCGLPGLPGGGCQPGTQAQVTFEVRAPKQITANVTPKQVAFSGSQAQTTLRLAVAMNKPNETLRVELSATCAGSRAARDVDFKVRELYRVVGRALDVRTASGTTTWRVNVESTGNAATRVRFEGVTLNATSRFEWTLPEPVTLPGQLTAGTAARSTTVLVQVRPAADSGQAVLFLRPGAPDGDNSTTQGSVTVPLSLIEFRGESPGVGSAFLLAVLALVAVRRR